MILSNGGDAGGHIHRVPARKHSLELLHDSSER
jgi:hypothetical protein